MAASYLVAMNEDEIGAVFDATHGLALRVRVGEQPTAEIAALAEDTFHSATAALGPRRWHESRLDGIVRSLNWHRGSRARVGASITGLTLALSEVALLAAPMETVIETAREDADEQRVSGLLAEIRTWR